jgi:hypothetical protein
LASAVPILWCGRRGNRSGFRNKSHMDLGIRSMASTNGKGLIEESHRVLGEEPAVELALREALSNAVLHGNRLDPCKLIQVRCRCELGYGVSMMVKDQGSGI